MGIKGAAIATVIAQVFSAIYCIYVLSNIKEIRISRNGISFDFAEIKNVKVNKNEERKFIEAVQQEFGFKPMPSYIGKVGFYD